MVARKFERQDVLGERNLKGSQAVGKIDFRRTICFERTKRMR